MEYALRFESIKRQVFMVCKNMKFHTKEHTLKFFESSNYGKHVFFCYHLILLWLCKLAIELDQRLSFLNDTCVWLKVCCFLVFWDRQRCFCFSLWSPWTAAFVVVCRAVHCPNCWDQQCIVPWSCWHPVQLQRLFCLRCHPMPLCFWRCCWFFDAFVCYWRCWCNPFCCAL